MKNKLEYIKPTITKQMIGKINKFGGTQNVLIKKHIDGVSIKSLTKKFGTPLFVISEKQIRENQRNALKSFRNRYPRVEFAWSYKTNYLNAVCNIFHSEGSLAEVVSEFELDKALKLGVNGEKIFFNGPNKSRDALIKAMQTKAKIHVDNSDELYEIFDIVEQEKLKANLAIRVNSDTGVYPKWDRFGFNFENGEAFEAAKKISQNKNCKLVGLHNHIGTFVLSTEPYRVAVKNLSVLASRIKNKLGVEIQYIDMGGGFASRNILIDSYLPTDEIAPSIDEYAAAITSELLQNFKQKPPKLILETGRALIDDAGFLISKVVATKRLTDGRHTLVVDAGVNILFTSLWYKHKVLLTEENINIPEDIAIYGPLCMNIDCLRDSIKLPPLTKGDIILFERVGAYNMTQWMQFIEMRPNVVLITKDGEAKIIRKAENLGTILQQEQE